MKTMLVLSATAFLVACSAQPTSTSSQSAESSTAEQKPTSEGMTAAERAAYRRGVNETLHELRGRMSVQTGKVFQPPIRECGVVPGGFVGGAYVKEHETCYTIAPGHFVTKESVYGVEGPEDDE